MTSTSNRGVDVLYTPRQIQIASFLGTPAAAAWFMSLNYKALSQPQQSHQILVYGGVATIVVFVIAFLLPAQTPSIALPVIYSLAIYVFAQSRLGATVDRHLADGGKRGSWWRVVWVSLLFCAVVIAFLIALVLLFPGLIPEATNRAA